PENETEQEEETVDTEEEQEEQAETEEEIESAEEEEQSTTSVNSGGISLQSILLIVLSIIGLVIVSFMIITREIIKSWWLTRHWEKILEADNIEKAYLTIVTRLEKKGYQRQKDQTLRQYAAELKEQHSMEDFYQITLEYEQWLYMRNKKIDKNQWR